MTNATARRAAIMELTADLRAELSAINGELACINVELDGMRNPTVRMARLSDRAWDLRARFDMICRQIERRVDAFVDA